MSALDSLSFDFSGDEAESGGGVPGGWYSTVIEDFRDSERVENAKELVLVVQSGAFKGSKIVETIFDPDNADTPEKAAQATKKIALWARRMGAWDGVPGSAVNWESAIGNKVVVQIETRSWKSKTGEQKEFTGITYAGIFPLDHPKIPEAIRTSLKLGPARQDAGDDAKPTASTNGNKSATASKPAAAAAPKRRSVADL
jgi:peptidyl-tRNA hydrolase